MAVFLYAREVADSVRKLETLAGTLRALLADAFAVKLASNDPAHRASIR